MNYLTEGRGPSKVKQMGDDILDEIRGKGKKGKWYTLEKDREKRKKRELKYKESQSEWRKERTEKKDAERAARQAEEKRQQQVRDLPFRTSQITSSDTGATATRKGLESLGNVASIGTKAVFNAIRNRKKREEPIQRATVREISPKQLKGSPPPPPKALPTPRPGLTPNSPPKALPSSRPRLPGRGATPNPPQTGFKRGMSAGQRARRNPQLKKQLINQRGGIADSYEYEFSCWREEFLYELGEARRNTKDREKPVDTLPSKKKNKVDINPNLVELYIQEENAPTNPELWNKAKRWAKSRYDVYPSAYANGAASKWYKQRGGGWKSGRG